MKKAHFGEILPFVSSCLRGWTTCARLQILLLFGFSTRMALPSQLPLSCHADRKLPSSYYLRTLTLRPGSA